MRSAGPSLSPLDELALLLLLGIFLYKARHHMIATSSALQFLVVSRPYHIKSIMHASLHPLGPRCTHCEKQNHVSMASSASEGTYVCMLWLLSQCCCLRAASCIIQMARNNWMYFDCTGGLLHILSTHTCQSKAPPSLLHLGAGRVFKWIEKSA